MNTVLQTELHPTDNKQQSNIIDINHLLNPTQEPLPIMDSINPIEEKTTKKEQDAHPIKSLEDINAIIKYFLSNNQYRNAMLFVVGINFGLRYSDLSEIRFKDLIDNNKGFRKEFQPNEKKTNNLRHIYINDAVKEIVTIYLTQMAENGVYKSLDDYLFVAEGTNNIKTRQIEYVDNEEIKYKTVQAPITIRAMNPILKQATEYLRIKGRFSTHSYRKTFAYHILLQENNTNHNERQIEFLQKIFGHSNQTTTLHYAGFTEDEIKAAYLNLNLGLDAIRQYKH
ncbi:tyrosine-type recombinase/integrase [Anaerovorax sp. IOR16]|uniref:tyrosine-type recombinase/integrase n=1 Tax=Anaerovorax sp. IOR16 TaxID=2773458 RepID=UPI0019D0F983|nr:tyrosine-type recombinase/integrase [Anaerovorax sp. IOR16]